MDGTLVDTAAGVTAAWEATVKRYPEKNLNVEEILSCKFFPVASFGAYNPVVCSISSRYQNR